ncbi:MAG TPA: tetratricopeptide repeat protein [Rhizomicrobium sp.]|jgi:tetratricopeptide (TPR) repeat protein
MTIEDESFREVSARLGDPLATVLATQPETADIDRRAYLREQTRLARLQSENLIEQNAFEISHLKWRRVADRVRGAGHIILVLLGLLIIVAIGAAISSAVNDHRLVVESFSVPPALTEQGETGTVIAQHVLDRIVAMQSGTQSLRAANSYRNNWGDDLKVQIPDTGISLGEVYRFLVSSIGRQTHITGEVVRSGSGFAVTARAGSGAGITVRGNDLDALLNQIAERLFGETQPYRYGIYLSSHGREKDSKAVLLALAQSDAPINERAWAYSGLLFVENDTRRSEQYGNAAVALNPDLLLAHNNLSAVAWRLGHSEFAYNEAETGLRLLNDDAGVELDQRVLGNMHSVLAEEADAALGDFTGAVREMRADIAIEHSGLRARSQGFLIRDLALRHDLAAARRIAIDPPQSGSTSTANRQLVLASLGHGLLEIEASNWSGARDELSKAIASLGPHYASFQLQAPLAYVFARLGNVAAARAYGAALPPDCYPCIIARARIEGLSHNWQAADSLFADAVRLGPSLPFAYTDWGAMLLARGEYDAAIAKLGVAHQKGPHFADPLELWGEALMQMNRSDLALAKFQDANNYAPNWSRLHHEWGKALMYLGRRDEAKQQFDIARSLSPDCAGEKAASCFVGSANGR